MIDYEKPVQTKSGMQVEILTIVLAGDYPILGRLGDGAYRVWDRLGNSVHGVLRYPLALENVPVKKRVVWVNIYKDAAPSAHTSLENAHDFSQPGIGIIGMVKVEIEEGQFDG